MVLLSSATDTSASTGKDRDECETRDEASDMGRVGDPSCYSSYRVEEVEELEYEPKPNQSEGRDSDEVNEIEGEDHGADSRSGKE